MRSHTHKHIHTNKHTHIHTDTHISTHTQQAHSRKTHTIFHPYRKLTNLQQQLYPWTEQICTQVGLARTIYIRCIHGNFGREITKYTVIYGAYIRFWSNLHTGLYSAACKEVAADLRVACVDLYSCMQLQEVRAKVWVKCLMSSILIRRVDQNSVCTLYIRT